MSEGTLLANEITTHEWGATNIAAHIYFRQNPDDVKTIPYGVPGITEHITLEELIEFFQHYRRYRFSKMEEDTTLVWVSEEGDIKRTTYSSKTTLIWEDWFTGWCFTISFKTEEECDAVASAQKLLSKRSVKSTDPELREALQPCIMINPFV